VSGTGRLIVFEGIDGCGKSTQVRRVADARGALATFEPGDTPLGAALRSVLLDPASSMTPVSEVLVLAADRAQHLAEVIEPALEQGRDVVCDRFSGSTLAYQGFGRGLDLGQLRAVLGVATAGRDADVTILLDCPVEVGRERRRGRGDRGDRFDTADAAFLDRVRHGFLALAEASPSWHVVDAAAPLDELSDLVDGVLDHELAPR
jgi:dTMP kinase